jgi:hypothetical protein
MNISKVRNSAAIVNYVKPELEMVEIEVESVLCISFSTGDDNTDPNAGKPAGTGGGDEISGSSYRPRTRRR